MTDQQPGDSPKMSEEKNENPVKLRPTLFVAIGGTGMEVLMRLRRRILNAIWAGGVRVESLSEFPVAQFIQFDLDQHAVIESGRAQTDDLQFDLLKFQDGEKLIETFDLEKYSRDDDALSRFPHIQSWLPITPTKIRELKIDPAKGAGQIRAVSRLYFFDQYPKIRDKIREKLKDLKAGLSRQEQLQRLGLDLDSSKVRVVVVGSVAGGTGSGSFLDMGWLARWLAGGVFPSADVELMLFLPTGFAGANKDRTEANGYSALMELETAMRGDADYVKRWDAYENPELPPKPYTDVYLVDSGNVAQQHTKNMHDVYHMVADALFEDFASADFANKKRSIAVNQQQHKIMPFSPPLPAKRFGDMKLAYSRSFSAFGQAVLDTQFQHHREERTHTWATDMLKEFFGVGEKAEGDNRRATDKHRDEFMATFMHLRSEPFSQFPEFSSKDVQLKLTVGSFKDFKIVDELLKDGHGPIEASVKQRVSAQMEEIKTGFKPEEWPTQIRERVRQMERDVVRDQDSGADTTEDRIARRRREIFTAIEKTLREQLFKYLDNKDYGGLEFVLSLVELVKDRLESSDTGVCATLEKNAKRYEEIKDAVRTHEYERLMANLGQTRGGLLSMFQNSEAQSRLVMEHIEKEIAHTLTFHLRAKAAREAADLMRALSLSLGAKGGVDADGQTQWSGLVGEFQGGRQAVLAMLASLDRSVTILRKDIAIEHVTLIPVAVSKTPLPLPPAATLRDWADEAFKDLGGSQELFKQLASAEGRPALLLRVVRMAERRVADSAPTNAAPESEPLIEALEQRSPAERQRLFKELLHLSMPWIDANLGRDFAPVADQYKCFVGVAQSVLFRKKFGEELQAAVPTGTGMTAAQIGIVETGIPGRAVCYTELSGIPLTILRGMEAWRTSYRKQSEILPTHTHIDITRFSHPNAPSTTELNGLADDFRWYLKAVMLGVLERVNRTMMPAGQYQFAVARGDVRRIGNERALRLNGLPTAYRQAVIERVTQALDDLDAPQCAALAALAHFYAKEVYTPQLIADDSGVEQPRVGFASAMAAEASQQLRDLALRKGATEPELARAMDSLLDEQNLRRWADPVPESDADAYAWEVRAPTDSRHPRLKFAMKRDSASRDVMAALVRGEPAPHGGSPGTALPASSGGLPPLGAPSLPPPPPLPVEHSYHVAIAGQSYGPYTGTQLRAMLQSRQVDPQSTQVWRNGFASWMRLAECAELLPPPLSMPPPPPPIVPLPPLPPAPTPPLG